MNEFHYELNDGVLKVYDGINLIEVKYEVADDEALELAQQIYKEQTQPT